MKNITDEMLNDYIDGLLNLNELKEIEEALKNDAKLLEKLRALKVVDKELRNQAVDKAPAGFAEKVMNIIDVPQRREPKAFFIGALSFIGILFATVLSVFLLAEKNTSVNDIEVSETVERLRDFFPSDFSFLKSFTLSNDLMIALGGLSLICLIFFYFLLHSHKAFKDDLNRFTA